MNALASALATIASSIARAIGSVGRITSRWCARSGCWIYEAVVEPALKYSAMACSGVLAGTIGLVPDVIGASTKLPGQLIRGTGAVLEGGGKGAGTLIWTAASVPGIALRTLFGNGGGGGSMPAPAPQQRERKVDDAIAALESRRNAEPAFEGSSLANRRAGMLGDIIHSFASASNDDRADIDLADLPPHIRDWLLALDEGDLQMMAKAGPLRCGRVASGKRSGIGQLADIERPRMEGLPTQEEIIEAMQISALMNGRETFGERIARAKGVSPIAHAA